MAENWKARALAAESELERLRARAPVGRPNVAAESDDGRMVESARTELGMNNADLCRILEIAPAQLTRAMRGALPVRARAQLAGMLAAERSRKAKP
jgi:hypothetical protein